MTISATKNMPKGSFKILCGITECYMNDTMLIEIDYEIFYRKLWKILHDIEKKWLYSQ